MVPPSSSPRCDGTCSRCVFCNKRVWHVLTCYDYSVTCNSNALFTLFTNYNFRMSDYYIYIHSYIYIYVPFDIRVELNKSSQEYGNPSHSMLIFPLTVGQIVEISSTTCASCAASSFNERVEDGVVFMGIARLPYSGRQRSIYCKCIFVRRGPRASRLSAGARTS